MFGLDLDGVLYPWHDHVYEWAKSNLRLDISYDDFWEWPGGWVYNNRENTIMNNMVNLPILYTKSPIVEDVRLAVWKIKEIMGEVCYITGRPETVRFDTKLWLERSNLPDVDKLFLTPSQFGAKLQLVKELECEFFVDDRLDYIEELLGHTELFLVTQLWNEEYENDKITRVDSVTDIPDLLEKV